MKKELIDLNLKKLVNLYESSDLLMLEYLKDFVPDEFKDLYFKVCDYNEIYGNDWNINELLKMGKQDRYWIDRANNFIKKYNVEEYDFEECEKFKNKYFELRNKLLDDMGLDMEYLSYEKKNLTEDGVMELEIVTNLDELNNVDSFTVARIINYKYCIELHYNEGNSTIEFGTRIKPNYWESDIEKITWFNKKISENSVLKKLEKLFKSRYEKSNQYRYLNECNDYFYLKRYLNQEQLKNIDDVLKDFEKYVEKNDDGKIDVVDRYKQEHGNDLIINWYEGLETTEEFLEQIIDKSIYDFNDVLKCIEKMEEEANILTKKSGLSQYEKYEELAMKHNGNVIHEDETDESYILDVYVDYEDKETFIEGTYIIRKDNNEVIVSDSFDIHSIKNPYILKNLSISKIDKENQNLVI